MRTRSVHVRKCQFVLDQREFEHSETPVDKRQMVLVFPPSGEIALPFCSGSGRTDQPDSKQRRPWNVEECSIEKSEYSSTEFQGFVGLTPGKPISTMSQSYCRITIANRPCQWFQPTGTSL